MLQLYHCQVLARCVSTSLSEIQHSPAMLSSRLVQRNVLVCHSWDRTYGLSGCVHPIGLWDLCEFLLCRGSTHGFGVRSCSSRIRMEVPSADRLLGAANPAVPMAAVPGGRWGSCISATGHWEMLLAEGPMGGGCAWAAAPQAPAALPYPAHSPRCRHGREKLLRPPAHGCGASICCHDNRVSHLQSRHPGYQFVSPVPDLSDHW